MHISNAFLEALNAFKEKGNYEEVYDELYGLLADHCYDPYAQGYLLRELEKLSDHVWGEMLVEEFYHFVQAVAKSGSSTAAEIPVRTPVLTIEYSDIIDTIVDGLLRFNEGETIGKLLITRSLTKYELNDPEELLKQMRFHHTQTAYQVLVKLKEQFGGNLRITQDDVEIMTTGE